MFCIGFDLQAQPENCSRDFICRVTAPSGMRMRSEPNLTSKVVTYVPKDSIVKACTEVFGKMTYEDINGNWRKVEYKGKEGYMFDGFLEIIRILKNEDPRKYKPDTTVADTTEIPDSTGEAIDTSLVKMQKLLGGTEDSSIFHLKRTTEPVKEEIEQPDPVVKEKPVETPKTAETEYTLLTEAYNYCGDIRAIDPGMLWYGYYPRDEKKGELNYRMKPVELEVVKSKYSVGKGLEFDIRTGETERSIFLLGLKRPMSGGQNIKDNSDMLRFSNRRVFPGQVISLTHDASAVKLSATGSVETAGPCPELTSYVLLLSGKKNGQQYEQNISQALMDSGQCGMPEIYWFGDFTGDGIPEIIFVSVYEDRNKFTLMVSSGNDQLLEKAAEWTIDKCY